MVQVITSCADKFCPYKTFNDRVALSPWMSQDLLELIKDRDRLYKLAKSTGAAADWINSRKARNKCNAGVKHAKDTFVKQQLDIHEHEPRKFWQTLNTIWSPADTSSPHINLADSSGNLLNDSDVPEAFNSHLCNVGRKLADKFKNSATSHNETPPGNNDRLVFEFVEVSFQEVEDLINKIKTYKSSAITGLTSRLLKDAFQALVPQLTYIFNQSLTTGKFPSLWKKANVVLLHKGSDRLNINNYRPISLLPLPGKLLETIIQRRLMDYLAYNEILTDRQWGVRPGRSTTDASAGLVESIVVSLNNKMHTGVLFIDLQKVFDSIDHSILLSKLNDYGVHETELRWFCSYLSDREQRVLVNNTNSNFCTITHGVPQGSCLGPLLFLIYINNISLYLPSSSLYLYADDTAILAVSDNATDLNHTLQTYANDLTRWCYHNKLNINISKSKVMHFSPSRISSPLIGHTLSVVIDNTPVEQVRHYKYLGYNLDDQLNCDRIFTSTVSKLNNILYIFRKIQPSLSLKASIAILKAKFISYIDYIILFSYMLSRKAFKKLQTLQNHCIRIAFCLPKRSNVDGLHCRLKLLHLEHKRHLVLMLYMYKQSRLLPDHPQTASTVNTRSSLKRNFPICRPH